MQAGGLARSAAEEIDRRLAADAVSTRGLSHLGRRMVARYARDPDHGVDDPSREAFERMESIPFTEGLERVPLRHAVARIAAAAGVPLELDESGLLAASIDPGRVISIPAYTLTCEQALDMVCGRSFATSGWAQVGWDVREGALVIGARASLEMHVRSLAIEFPWNDTAAPPSRYPRFVSVSATWPSPCWTSARNCTAGEAGWPSSPRTRTCGVQRLVRPSRRPRACPRITRCVPRSPRGSSGPGSPESPAMRPRRHDPPAPHRGRAPRRGRPLGLDLHIAYRDTLSRSPLRRSMTAADPVLERLRSGARPAIRRHDHPGGPTLAAQHPADPRRAGPAGRRHPRLDARLLGLAPTPSPTRMWSSTPRTRRSTAVPQSRQRAMRCPCGLGPHGLRSPHRCRWPATGRAHARRPGTGRGVRRPALGPAQTPIQSD